MNEWLNESILDYKKTGALIRQRRREKALTQMHLANLLQISDKAVSKWERGLGCPDVSLINRLAELLELPVEALLTGILKENQKGENMKHIQFYTCSVCGNVMSALKPCSISCCGRTMHPLNKQASDEKHTFSCEITDGQRYIQFHHDMLKSHYITFAAYITYTSCHLIRLYPEQNAEIRIPLLQRGILYYCCSQDGLFSCEL